MRFIDLFSHKKKKYEFYIPKKKVYLHLRYFFFTMASKTIWHFFDLNIYVPIVLQRRMLWMTRRFLKQNSTIFYKEESKQQKRTPLRSQACARYASNSEKPPDE